MTMKHIVLIGLSVVLLSSGCRTSDEGASAPKAAAPGPDVASPTPSPPAGATAPTPTAAKEPSPADAGEADPSGSDNCLSDEMVARKEAEYASEQKALAVAREREGRIAARGEQERALVTAFIQTIAECEKEARLALDPRCVAFVAGDAEKCPGGAADTTKSCGDLARLSAAFRDGRASMCEPIESADIETLCHGLLTDEWRCESLKAGQAGRLACEALQKGVDPIECAIEGTEGRIACEQVRALLAMKRKKSAYCLLLEADLGRRDCLAWTHRDTASCAGGSAATDSCRSALADWGLGAGKGAKLRLDLFNVYGVGAVCRAALSSRAEPTKNAKFDGIPLNATNTLQKIELTLPPGWAELVKSDAALDLQCTWSDASGAGVGDR